MKIKITAPVANRMIRPGQTFTAQDGGLDRNGKRVYFIHYAGEWLGISARECEVVPETDK